MTWHEPNGNQLVVEALEGYGSDEVCVSVRPFAAGPLSEQGASFDLNQVGQYALVAYLLENLKRHHPTFYQKVVEGL